MSPDEYHALERDTAALAVYAADWDLDVYAKAWDAAAAAQRAAMEQPPARRVRRTRNLSTILLVLCFVALAALWPNHSHAQGRPVCSVVQHTTLVLDGRYGRVECPEGPLTVALPSGVAPVNGPARVQLVARQGTVVYRLVDNSNNVYPIVQE
jgi:hypothetical protein